MNRASTTYALQWTNFTVPKQKWTLQLDKYELICNPRHKLWDTSRWSRFFHLLHTPPPRSMLSQPKGIPSFSTLKGEAGEGVTCIFVGELLRKRIEIHKATEEKLHSLHDDQLKAEPYYRGFNLQFGGIPEQHHNKDPIMAVENILCNVCEWMTLTLKMLTGLGGRSQ